MKYYKIVGIHPEKDRMERLVSDTIYIEYLKEGNVALLVYVDEELEPSYGKCMRTSTVQEVRESGGIIEIVTMNNTYTLRELALVSPTGGVGEMRRYRSKLQIYDDYANDF